MNIYALQTARAGSKSVRNKNTYMNGDIPLFAQNVSYAKESRVIKDVFVSTDDYTIQEYCRILGINVINRPLELCQDNSSHYDTIVHGLHYIEAHTKSKIDMIVVLLGNNNSAYTHEIDMAITDLQLSDCDSCMSVSRFNMFNPYRAYKLENGKLDTIIPQSDYITQLLPESDKNAFGDTYFFNGSFWVIKRRVLLDNNGLKPFTWLGRRILPYIQKEGIMEIDAEWQLRCLQ